MRIKRMGAFQFLGTSRMATVPNLSPGDAVPQAFEITSNKGQYKAINPAQIMMRA